MMPLKTTLNVALCPAVSVPIVQVNVPVAPGASGVQVNVGPLVCVTLANVAFAGTVSVIVTVDAVDGPLFVTVIVNAPVVPLGAVAGVLVMARSATVWLPLDDAVLFAGLGSGVVLETVAVFVIVPPKAAAVWTTMVSVALPPDAIDGIVQVIVPVPPTAGLLHEKPAPEAETNVVFAGTASITEIDCAVFGPALLTVTV